MKHGKAIIARADRIRAAVTAAVIGKGCPCPGARIEEILGEEIVRYPDQIMSLDLLPSLDLFEFIGYDSDFNELPCLQLEYAPGKFTVDAGTPLVGWKPLRMGDTALAGRIAPSALVDTGFSDKKTCYEEAEPYKGVPFCRGNRHPGPPCKDPFCYLRRI